MSISVPITANMSPRRPIKDLRSNRNSNNGSAGGVFMTKAEIMSQRNMSAVGSVISKEELGIDIASKE